MTVLKAAGVTAVGRYIGWDGEPGYSNIRKNLTITEARALLAAGIDIFVVFEYAADAALKGAVQGTADAHLAARQLHDLGAPAGGTLSLRQFEAQRYQVADPNDPAVIRGVILAANLTMEHGTLAERKALVDYVVSPGSTQAMPAGLVFYTLNP